MTGFVKLQRGPDAEELIKDGTAFLLLTQVAYRARWKNSFNADGLVVGEALLGDFQNCGIPTRQKYREALHRLEKWRFVTTRTTNKGTVARLCDSRVWDIFGKPEQPPPQPSGNHPTTTEQPLTRPKKTENTTPPPPAPPVAGEFANYIDRFRKIRVEFTDPRLQDFQVVEAVRCCPQGPDRERGFADFERDMPTAMTCPDNPVKLLRGYMARAAEGSKKKRKVSTHEYRGEYPENERPLPSL